MAKKVPEINSSSTADIAFIILIFFLMTTTMNVDSGIQRILPPIPEDKEVEIEVNKRNVLLVFVSKSNDIMVGGERIDIWQVKDKVKEFVTNPYDNENLSSKKLEENIDLIGDYMVSEGVVSLQNDRGTSYATYIEVQNELTRAFNEIRDEVSLQKFHMPYSELNEDQQRAIGKAVPQKISEAEPRNVGGV